ncbi:B-type cyclin [Naganishia albida]|nr:B-type cyclin [Naganishia albida]
MAVRPSAGIRTRMSTRVKNDENAPPVVSHGSMDGVAAGKSVVHGGKDLKPKVSNANLAASGVLGQRRANQGVSVKAEPAVKAGAKRPALGNISNSGVKDPHVDTDIPMKHTKVSGPTRSRSTSVVSTKSGTGRTSKTNENASIGPPRNAARTSRTAKSTSALAVSSHSGNVQTSSSREAVTVKQETKIIGSIAEEGMMVDDAATSLHDVKPSRTLEANGSGLTPSLGEMGVEVSSAIDVAEHQELGYDSEDDIGLRGEDADDVDDEEAIMVDDEDDWLALTEEQQIEVENTLTHVRETFDDEVDMYDTTMVAEYADDIFFYMSDLEERAMPNPHYMEYQNEIQWEMRTTLIDWLLQVHLRYHMLPETLWIAVNIVDRFLSLRVVSLIKLQLVGVTAMFVAAKYEEILAPSVDEFVYMTENGYTKEEILKGERIILQTLNFDISSYCTPYSWVRRISKADDYDIQTRTLSKFLMEVTLLDHRFLRCKPSLIAAIGMFTARKMLDGDWNDAFVFYSNYTETQLLPGARIMIEQLAAPDFDKQYVYKKYTNKKFLRASTFARDWARTHVTKDGEAAF